MTPASAHAPRLNLTIATRESRLALWQAQHVQALLQAAGHRVELLGLTTRGDQILDRTLSKVGGKGLFVKELEVALEEGRADLAVHSLKDVPMELPAGFMLAAVLPREDPRDAWVSPHCDHPRHLPPHAVVGTSSLRRLVLLRALLRDYGRDDVRIEPLRGNLDTRLRKLDEGQYHAIVLAAAGLKRLGLQQRIRHLFDPQEMLPAAGQGALGLEVLQARADVAAVLAPLADWATWCAVEAERAVSRALGGSCSVPLAAHASWAGAPPATPGTSALLTLHAAWGDAETAAPLCTTSVQEEIGTLQAARALGERAARALLRQGARGASV